MAKGRLNHQDQHWGLYKKANSQEKKAYLKWSSEKGGFVLYYENDSVAIPTVFRGLRDLQANGYSFTISHSIPEMEPVA